MNERLSLICKPIGAYTPIHQLKRSCWRWERSIRREKKHFFYDVRLLKPPFSSSSIGYTELKGMCWRKKKNENRKESIKDVADMEGADVGVCNASICRWILNLTGRREERRRQAINSFACIGKCRCYHPGNNFISVFLFSVEGENNA